MEFKPGTKTLVFITAAVFLIFFSRYFIHGKDSKILIHDNMDHVNLVGIFNGAFEGDFFINNDKPNFYFPGENKTYLLQRITPDSVIYKFFGYFNGFILNQFLIKLIGFFAMLFLLQRINAGYFSVSRLIPLFIALSFAMLPHHPADNLGAIGVPVIIALFYMLYRKQFTVPVMTALFLFPFYSGFTTTGVFIEALLAAFVLFLALKKSPFLKTAAIAFTIHTTGWIISNYSVFLAQFMDGPTHRSVMQGGYLSFTQALSRAAGLFLSGQYHAHSLHRFIILPSSVLIAAYLLITKKEIKLFRLLALLLAYNIFSSLVYGFYYFEPVKKLSESLHIGFQYNRFYFIGVSFWYILWAVLIYNFMFHFKNKKSAFVMTGLVLLAQLSYVISFNGYPYEKDMPSFRQFMSEDMFSEIKKKINYNPKDYAGCIGFYPSTANYNGIRTIGAYSNLYSLSYKKKFRQVISAELENSPQLKKYFDDWGNRAYLFDDETGRYFTKKDKITTKLNMTALKDLGAKYIFSAAEISNAESAGLKEVYRTKEEYYYDMYVYLIQ